jgi:hypothetical protein
VRNPVSHIKERIKSGYIPEYGVEGDLGTERRMEKTA